MRQKSKWMAFPAAFALLVAACGSDSESSSADTEDPVVTEAPSAPDDSGSPDDAGSPDDTIAVALVLNVPRNDLSWAQTAVEGLEGIEAAGDITLTIIEGVSEDPATTRNLATDLAEAGNDLVIFHSFSFGESILELSDEFPDVNFAWPGGLGAEFGGLAENVADYDQPFYQASYLAGILSGGVSESDKIGGIAGFDIPVCHAMLEAFASGYRELVPEAELIATYVGSWIDAPLAKEAALAQYEAGVEVINPCGVQDGTIQAAIDADGKLIGYVGDQTSLAEQNIPFSMIWNLDVLYQQMITDVRSGEFQPGKFYQPGIAEGALSVEINPEYSGDIDPDAIALYEERLAEIESGAFEVPFILES